LTNVLETRPAMDSEAMKAGSRDERVFLGEDRGLDDSDWLRGTGNMSKKTVC
jgi:hypothetical protein